MGRGPDQPDLGGDQHRFRNRHGHAHDIEEPDPAGDLPDLPGDRTDHAADGPPVHRVLRHDQGVRLESLLGEGGCDRLQLLGHRRNGRSGARRAHQHPEDPV